MARLNIIGFLLLFSTTTFSQAFIGTVLDKTTNQPIAYAVVTSNNQKNICDSVGKFKLNSFSQPQQIIISCIGYYPLKTTLSTTLYLQPISNGLEEVVITGTLKEVRKSESPVPVEIFTPAFFKKNPSSCVFDALQNVNGVRPQLNCNICNTGDIHINGLEALYNGVD
jgi:outer membrane receptor for ferrienterochelin and colicins